MLKVINKLIWKVVLSLSDIKYVYVFMLKIFYIDCERCV